MNIPKRVKIGDLTYCIKFTSNLQNGILNASAEIDYGALEIRICPSEKARQEADLFHEMMHAIMDNLGYKVHDEKQIDEMAHALHALIVDNPQMFKEVN